MLLHLHGGGFVMGVPEIVDARNRWLVRETQCVVVSVDYRRAPDTAFPGALEDCYAALAWVYDNARELGVDAARIAVGGESAGGGLAAAVALLARDRGRIPLALQLLVYPMLDDRTCTRTDTAAHFGEFIWSRRSNEFGWRALLGREPGTEGVSSYAAPARAQSLAGLPRTFIAVGGLDLFLEEDIDYARRLMQAGVPTELHVLAGAYHGFDMVPKAFVTRELNRHLRAALNRAFQPDWRE
ncbi:MAG: alpha/beta hydrolase [Steroidobacteraceae bacterium]